MLAPPPPNPGSSPRVHVRSSKRPWSSAAAFCLGTAVPGSWPTQATGAWDAPFQSPKMGQKWKENGLASKNSHENHLELGESTSINSATQLSLVSTCPFVRIELHLLINFLVSAILSCPESCLEVNPAEGFKIPSRSQSNHSIQCPYYLIFFDNPREYISLVSPQSMWRPTGQFLEDFPEVAKELGTQRLDVLNLSSTWA